jgi:hypothetical protein
MNFELDGMLVVMAKIDADAESEMDTVRGKLAELQTMADAVVERKWKKLESLWAENGFTKCLHCNGFGKMERFDSGYMRRFQLREWNGCTKCGGNGNDVAGMGFVKKE